MTDVNRVDLLEWLLLRRHDPLEVGVARLVQPLVGRARHREQQGRGLRAAKRVQARPGNRPSPATRYLTAPWLASGQEATGRSLDCEKEIEALMQKRGEKKVVLLVEGMT